MSAIIPPSVSEPRPAQIVYPESDGKPMAESTKQYRWIVTLTENLIALFRDREDVFVCADQFWYPVQGHPEIVTAPDTYVVFGRPKKDRPSWKQWEEDGVPMTVVFEVLSPSNTVTEMSDKLEWYDRYGVEEYYVFDPERNHLTVYRRGATTLVGHDPAHNYRSPRLGIRFDLSVPEMVVYYPDGRRFLPFSELDALRAEAEKQAADAQKQAADAQKQAARLTELLLKLRRGQATPEDLAEIDRLGTNV